MSLKDIYNQAYGEPDEMEKVAEDIEKLANDVADQIVSEHEDDGDIVKQAQDAEAMGRLIARGCVDELYKEGMSLAQVKAMGQKGLSAVKGMGSRAAKAIDIKAIQLGGRVSGKGAIKGKSFKAMGKKSKFDRKVLVKYPGGKQSYLMTPEQFTNARLSGKIPQGTTMKPVSPKILRAFGYSTAGAVGVTGLSGALAAKMMGKKGNK